MLNISVIAGPKFSQNKKKNWNLCTPGIFYNIVYRATHFHIGSPVSPMAQGPKRIFPRVRIEVTASCYSVLCAVWRCAVTLRQRIMLEIVVPETAKYSIISANDYQRQPKDHSLSLTHSLTHSHAHTHIFFSSGISCITLKITLMFFKLSFEIMTFTMK